MRRACLTHVSVLVLAASSVLVGCDDRPIIVQELDVTPPEPGQKHERLSDWGLFEDIATQVPNDGVEAYEVNSPLFSDYALKRRFVWLPDGTTMTYNAEAPWELPVGAVAVKTFSFLADERDPTTGERLMETRLLVREEDGFTGHTYVYRDTSHDAEREVAGETVTVNWTNAGGHRLETIYSVPDTNACQDCHGEAEAQHTLGLRTAQFDRDFLDSSAGNQIDGFTARGLLDRAPPPAERVALVDPFSKASISERARSYLDSNCGHCHRKDAGASQSGLFLRFSETDPQQGDPGDYGVCKVPTSAGGATCGHTYDVVPGNPDASILICRVASPKPQVRMPPVGSLSPHAEGVALLRRWIGEMPSQSCVPGQ